MRKNSVAQANLRREVARDNLVDHLKNHDQEDPKHVERHEGELKTLKQRISAKEPYRKYRKRKV